MSVFLTFVALAIVAAAVLDRNDRLVRRQMADLRSNGKVEFAAAVVTQVRGGRDLLIVKLSDEQNVGVSLGALARPRPDTVLEVRVVRDGAGKKVIAAELVKAPLRSMGRALTVSVVVCTLLLGSVFALLT